MAEVASTSQNCSVVVIGGRGSWPASMASNICRPDWPATWSGRARPTGAADCRQRGLARLPALQGLLGVVDWG